MTGSIINKCVLVVGDWVVDENWIVTNESSSPLYHEGVGKQRYCSRKTNIHSQILSLCAAGGVTRMLNSLNGEEVNIEIYGLGFWEPSDTKILSCLCRYDKRLNNQTPLTLQSMDERDNNAGPVKNYGGDGLPDLSDSPNLENKVESADCPMPLCKRDAGCLKCDRCIRLHSLSKDDSGTWRVLRIHSQTGPKPPQIIQRYDWEVSENIQSEKWSDKGFSSRIQQKLDEIANTNRELRGTDRIDVIVIVDHVKGSITRQLIHELAIHESTKVARWYVRTKDSKSDVDWLHEIRNRLRLLFLGPMNIALENDPWFLGQHLSAEGIRWMAHRAHMPDLAQASDSHIVVVFHEDSKLTSLIPRNMFHDDGIQTARTAQGGKGPVLLLTKKAPQPGTYTIGQATVLFSSLISCLEDLDSGEYNHGKLSTGSMIRPLNRSHSWCRLHENDLNAMPFQENEDINFNGHFYKILRAKPKNTNPEDYGFQLQAYDLGSELSSWENSTKGL